MRSVITTTALAALVAIPAAGALAEEPARGGSIIVTYQDDIATGRTRR